jgi:hypothetical protein
MGSPYLLRAISADLLAWEEEGATTFPTFGQRDNSGAGLVPFLLRECDSPWTVGRKWRRDDRSSARAATEACK